MAFDFNTMSDKQSGFAKFIGANATQQKEIANLIQSKGEKSQWRKFKTKFKIKAKNKTTQKVVTGVVVVGGIVAAPFTGGVSGVAAAALAAAMWAGGKVIDEIAAKLVGPKSPDKVKDSIKSALIHLEKAGRFGTYLSAWSTANEDVQIQNANGQVLLSYDPDVPKNLFKFAHHVWKAEQQMKQLEEVMNELRKGLQAVKGVDERGKPLPGKGPDQIVTKSWEYSLEKLHVASRMGVSDIFDPKAKELQTIADKYAEYSPGLNGAPPSPPQRTMPNSPNPGQHNVGHQPGQHRPPLPPRPHKI